LKQLSPPVRCSDWVQHNIYL